MKPYFNLKDYKFGRLSVLERSGTSGDGKTLWLCRCDCGEEIIARGNQLRKGQIRSCGCLKIERLTTHGLSKRAEYHVWEYMIQRCTNPKCRDFPLYGGRGILVCERWKKFADFYSDMGPRPSDDLTIDRIDNDGNYEPGNCRWTTQKVQKRNFRRSRLITAFGKTAPLVEFIVGDEVLSKEKKPLYMKAWFLLRKGYDAERALAECGICAAK